MKTFDKRSIALLAALMLTAGGAYAQPSSGGSTSQNAGPGGMQPGGQGKGTTMGKGGTMATPASPNAAHSGMWDASLFQRLDTNHDGMISREEAQADAMVRDSWSQLDAKSTGRVSRADFDRFGAARNPANAGTTGTTGTMGSGTTSSSSTSGSMGSTGSTGSTSGAPKK